MEQFYFDTSIWIDIFDQRGENGEYAAALVEKILANDWMILYSDMVTIELKQIGLSDHELLRIFGIAKPDHLRRVHMANAHMTQSKKIAKPLRIPWGDALHAMLAREHGAQLVSRDHDFEKLKHITTAKKPEDLL